MSRKPKLLGIGIDILNKKRVKRLWAQYSSKTLSQLFSSSEKLNFRKQKISLNHFAKCFAAKEAFFKALGLNAMGLVGFSQMSVQFLESTNFVISTKHPEKKTEIAAKGVFFESNRFFGAHVMVWG